MWGIRGITHHLRHLRIIPKPKPKPPVEHKNTPPPTEHSNAKKAEHNQLGLQSRNKLERQRLEKINPNNPSPEQIRQIAKQGEPNLVLPTSDSTFKPASVFGRNLIPNLPQDNLPADPKEYIANSQLREDVPAGVRLSAPDWNPFNGIGNPLPVSVSGKDNQIGDNINNNPNDNFTSADVGNVRNERYFLDLKDGMSGKLGSPNAPVFYQYEPPKDGEPPKMTYHIFYADNDAPKADVPVSSSGQTVPVDLNHKGDWERITYELNPKTLQPEKAVLSAHNSGSTIDFKDLDKDPATGRPLIYVANGSHANYAKPGNHAVKFGGVTATYDRTAVDENGDGKVNEKDNAVIFDTARNLKHVKSQPWYPGNERSDGRGVRWGEIGVIKDSSGPQGPSYHKGAVTDDNNPRPVFTALAKHLGKNPREFNDYVDSLPPAREAALAEKARLIDLVDKDVKGVYNDHKTRYNSGINEGNYYFGGTPTLIDLKNWMRKNGYSDAPGI